MIKEVYGYFFLQIFVKTTFLVTLNFDTKSALNLKTKNMHRPNSFKGRYQLVVLASVLFINKRSPYGHFYM